MVCIDFQLDSIYNHHGDRPLGVSMREFLDLINRGEKVHPKHGQYHFEGWYHKLLKKPMPGRVLNTINLSTPKAEVAKF